jgi:hypothetical protein
MTLSQKHRHSIFERLSPTLGEEETEALLSQSPSLESEEPVTNHRLDAAIAAVRGDVADVRVELARLEASLVERMRQQLMWTFGAVVSGLGVGMGIAAAVSQAIG